MGGIRLDDIEDPAEGLALLAKAPPQPETPEQERLRLFWLFMFTQWQYWLAGDTLAIGRAMRCCGLLRMVPPRWLGIAVAELIDKRMSPAEHRQQEDLDVHQMRWEAACMARSKGNIFEECWEIAAEMLKGSDAGGADSTMRASFYLIEDAGGSDATRTSYLEAVARRDRKNN